MAGVALIYHGLNDLVGHLSMVSFTNSGNHCIELNGEGTYNINLISQHSLYSPEVGLYWYAPEASVKKLLRILTRTKELRDRQVTRHGNDHSMSCISALTKLLAHSGIDCPYFELNKLHREDQFVSWTRATKCIPSDAWGTTFDNMGYVYDQPTIKRSYNEVIGLLDIQLDNPQKRACKPPKLII